MTDARNGIWRTASLVLAGCLVTGVGTWLMQPKPWSREDLVAIVKAESLDKAEGAELIRTVSPYAIDREFIRAAVQESKSIAQQNANTLQALERRLARIEALMEFQVSGKRLPQGETP